MCEDARRHYPEDLEILFQEALTRRDLGDRKSAITCLERLLEHRDGQHFASIDTGLRGYKTRHNLAVWLHEDDRCADAEKQWRLALEEQPNFLPALAGLADMYLAQRNWPAFDECLARLFQVGKHDPAPLTMTARKHLALGEFALARQAVEHAITAHPQAVWPRMILTHILLQEGKDWVAAEKALRDVLAMDPNNVEARQNLDVLLRQREASP